MKILLIEDEKEVRERCKGYLEEQGSDIKIDSWKGSNNMINKIDDDYSGIILDLSRDDFDESKFYDVVKNNGTDLNFILSIDEDEGTGSIKLCFYKDIQNRIESNRDLKRSYDLIDTLFDTSNNEFSNDNNFLKLEETIQLLSDRYVKFIFGKISNSSRFDKKIEEEGISKAVFYRRLKKLKELGLIEKDQNKYKNSTSRSYNLNLEDCRLSYENGIISAEFRLDEDLKKVYGSKKDI